MLSHQHLCFPLSGNVVLSPPLYEQCIAERFVLSVCWTVELSSRVCLCVSVGCLLGLRRNGRVTFNIVAAIGDKHFSLVPEIWMS